MTNPNIRKTRGISPVWSLPIIALCICGWLLYSSYQNAGVEITIYFKDATGIVPGKTQVIAKGIPVGVVKDIQPDLAKQRVRTVVKMEQVVVDYLVEDTLFWIVRAELSAGSIQGLETIFSGSYIGIQAGESPVLSSEFEGLASAPPIAAKTPGLHFDIKADVLGSIQVGTGIYYRNIEIGKVQGYSLVGDDNIIIAAFVKPEFAHLVRKESRFCNASGVQISGKLPNLKFKVESIASLLKGGIMLHTPEQLKKTPQASNGHVFTLYPDYEAASYGIPMTLTLASGEDIIEGSTKIKYRGFEAGVVKEIQINDDKQKSVTAHILLDPRLEFILREATQFWLVKAVISPSGVSNLTSLLSGAHITFHPGSGSYTNHFTILPAPPPQAPLRSGKTFVLRSEEPVNLSPQSPVYFKNVHVGEVISIDLEKSGRSIQTTIFIYQDSLYLLSKKSVFWMHAGVEIDASIESGLSVSTGPLATLLHGGISFTTPDKLQKQKNYPPEEGFQFPLYTSFKEGVEATPDLKMPGKSFFIVSENANSLSIGAPILHKNIKIGEIESFKLTKNQKNVLIKCFVYQKFVKLLHSGSRFFNMSGVEVSGSLRGINVQIGSIQSILAGGIGCINVTARGVQAVREPYQLYAHRKEALEADDLELKLFITKSNGLKEGAPIRHKGIVVGQITKLHLTEDLQTIVATARVKKHTTPLFRTNTQLWIEKAQIGLSGMKNMETIIFGSFLSILPGDGAVSKIFQVLPEPPYTEIANRSGLGLILETNHLGSLSTGAPVYYRQVQVGEVTGYQLAVTFQVVQVYITIYSQFEAIIRENTKFWNVSGAKIKGGVFSGLTIATESMEALMRGGVALATPDTEKSSPKVGPGYHFKLYEEPEKKWLDWNPNIVLLEEEEQEHERVHNEK